jgi:hypothetical protein
MTSGYTNKRAWQACASPAFGDPNPSPSSLLARIVKGSRPEPAVTTSDHDPSISYLDVFPLLVAACPTYPDSTHAIDADTPVPAVGIDGQTVAP